MSTYMAYSTDGISWTPTVANCSYKCGICYGWHETRGECLSRVSCESTTSYLGTVELYEKKQGQSYDNLGEI